jgi:hypothetical protein
MIEVLTRIAGCFNHPCGEQFFVSPTLSDRSAQKSPT